MRATKSDTRIDEIVDGIYRISTWAPEETGPITFNQFLIDDERPALIHTGVYPAYESVRAAVSQVLDPARLEYVALLHFEADECGGMDRFLEGAPESTLVGSALSVDLNLGGWSYRGKTWGFRDGELLDLGTHKLRFLETPHVHHWDSMMLFDETTRSVFPSDLYIQPGPQPRSWTRILARRCAASTARSGSSPTSTRSGRSSTGSTPCARSGCTRCTAARWRARPSPTTPEPYASSHSRTRASCWAARSRNGLEPLLSRR